MTRQRLSFHFLDTEECKPCFRADRMPPTVKEGQQPTRARSAEPQGVAPSTRPRAMSHRVTP
jgi:hypothetical protein